MNLNLIFERHTMNNLYIITKQEFASLYRFGEIPLIKDKIIKKERVNENDEILKKFLSLPYFVGDEEYLVIEYSGESNILKIDNVSEIIPLTEAAKKSFEMKFDAKLNFKSARFEVIIREVEKQINIEEKRRGAQAFWKLCKVTNEFKPLLSNELIESAYNKRINATKSYEFQDDFFIHLLAYDRYEFYPKTKDIGYFYDTIEIFANSIKAKKSFKDSFIYKFLKNKEKDLSNEPVDKIAQIISESDEVTKFTEQLTSDGLKKYIVAAIFLKFKDDLAERNTYKGSETEKFIGKARANNLFKDELNHAIYLTGLFFGYEKFYDDLYDLINLKIFKKSGNISQTCGNSDKLNDKKQMIDSKADTEVAITEDANKPDTSKLQEITEKLKGFLNKICESDNIPVEIKKEKLDSLKKILKPLFKEKTPNKEQIIEILKSNFSDIVNIREEPRNNTYGNSKFGFSKICNQFILIYL